MSHLITNSNTRLFDVDLATKIGLNEAIVLQQIQYWIEIKENDPTRYKDSFQDGRMWIYNSISKWKEQFPFWSYDTVKRTFKSLETKGLVHTGNYNKLSMDKTKWYCINYEKLDELIDENTDNNDECKMPQSIRANCTNGTGQNDPTNTKDYTENTTETTIKGIKGTLAKPKAQTLDYTILSKQIDKCICESGYSVSDEDKEFLHEVIERYYKAYKSTFGEEHPILSNNALTNVICNLLYADSAMLEKDIYEYEVVIDQHFKTQYADCDYNICHFTSGVIRELRIYETCY